jgi:hypothetical protein
LPGAVEKVAHDIVRIAQPAVVRNFLRHLQREREFRRRALTPRAHRRASGMA